MPTTIDSAGITFNDATSLTSANIGTAQLVNGSVTAAKLGTTEQNQICKAFVAFNGNTSPYDRFDFLNVTSITFLGNSNYQVNYATGTFANTDYTVLLSMSPSSTSGVANGIPYITNRTASYTVVAAQVATNANNAVTEPAYVSVAVFTSN
jgi:hypothetical protein